MSAAALERAVRRDGRDLFYMTLPATGRCYRCRCALPPPTSPCGCRPRWCSTCNRARRAEGARLRRSCRQAARDFVPYQKKDRALLVAGARLARPRRRRQCRWHLCACGVDFYAGHRARECWDCRRATVVQNERARYLRRRAARAAERQPAAG